MIKKAVNKFNKQKLAYLELVQSGKDDTKYSNEDYKKLIYFKKRKSEKAVPTRAIDLKQRYNDIKERESHTLKEHLTNCGFYADLDNFEMVKSPIAQRTQREGRIVECEALAEEVMANGVAEMIGEREEV